MGPRGNAAADLGRMQAHRLAVATGQHEAGALALLGTDRANYASVGRALVSGRCGPCPAPRPTSRQSVRLTVSGLVLTSESNRRDRRQTCADGWQVIEHRQRSWIRLTAERAGRQRVKAQRLDRAYRLVQASRLRASAQKSSRSGTVADMANPSGPPQEITAVDAA